MNSNDTDARALLRPSKLQQYAACPGSYRMQLGLSEPPSPDAEEGTRLHAAVATGDADGLDSEQSDLVRQCTEYLAALVERTGLDHVTYEQPLTIRDSYGEEITHGTADIVATSPDHPDRCAVVDWKFGRVPVEATATNLQLAAYALGAMQLSGASECEAHVFQPRIGRHVCHVFAASDAIQRNLRAISEACTAEALVLNPGEEQCRYCLARSACPALRMRLGELATGGEAEAARTDPDAVARNYETAQLAKRMVADAEERMRDYLDQHGECLGYRYREVAGRREVDDICHAAVMLSDILTNSEYLGCCTVSVPQLEGIVCDRLQAQAEAHGEKLSRADAKKQFAALLDGALTRGEPTRKIERREETAQ
jgi:hypothetical protein